MADEQKERDIEGAGFEIVGFSTSTGGFTYEAEVPQADDWKVYYNFWKSQGENPDEVLTQILNAQNKQTGTQSPKQTVREVVQELQEAEETLVDDDGELHPKLAEAVEAANESSRGYVLGAPRAGGGGGARHESGLTKKEREAFGTAIATASIKKGGALSAKEQREVAEELGIDPDLLKL